MMFVSSRFKGILLFPLLLCLCLVLTGCQGGTVRVYEDKYQGSKYELVLGLSWISPGMAGAVMDRTVPDDAVLQPRCPFHPKDENGTVQGFWEGLGFTFLSGADNSHYYIRGTKAQWQHLITAPEMEDTRTLIGRSRSNGIGRMNINATFPNETGFPYNGVRYYAKHPEKFVDPPTVSYLYVDRIYYTSAEAIPALLEREDVSQIRFVGHYMVKE